MKKKYLNLLAIVLVFAILFSITQTAFASKYPYTHTYEIAEVHKQELRDMGFNDTEIARLESIGNQLLIASNGIERDALMREYHTLIDGTPYAANSSIWSPSGGTLELEYNGDLNPISNVIYTKIIYLPSEQVVYYQRAMNDDGFLEFLVSEGIVGFVTEHALAKIAVRLGLSTTTLGWLLGISISSTFYILENLERMDINAAIDASTTGKLKLEYYYMTSANYPYYQSFQNFEPWNSVYIDIPEDYDYIYHTGEFNFE